jgi:hypothetical protein
MNIDDINEFYIRELYDLEKERKAVKNKIGVHSLSSVVDTLSTTTHITLDKFIEALNKFRTLEEKKFFPREIEIVLEETYDYYCDGTGTTQTLNIYEVRKESDNELIKRLITNERSKLRRQLNKQRAEEEKERRELETYRWLRKKYGKKDK